MPLIEEICDDSSSTFGNEQTEVSSVRIEISDDFAPAKPGVDKASNESENKENEADKPLKNAETEKVVVKQDESTQEQPKPVQKSNVYSGPK